MNFTYEDDGILYDLSQHNFNALVTNVMECLDTLTHSDLSDVHTTVGLKGLCVESTVRKHLETLHNALTYETEKHVDALLIHHYHNRSNP